MPSKYAPAFFDLIGKECPVKGYEYKFEIDPARWLKTLSSAARELNVTFSWLHNFVRLGRINPQRHNGQLFVDSTGMEEIKKIRDEEYMPRVRGKSGSGRMCGDDVIKELRIHSRRIPELIQKAGIIPTKTPRGQYRFTREEVERMRPFSEKRHSFPNSKK